MDTKASKYHGSCGMCIRFDPIEPQQTFKRCLECMHLYGGINGKDNWKPKRSKSPKSDKASKISLNIGYVSALRERVNKYFPGFSYDQVSNFIKAVQRLNKKEWQ